jgi:hypothetical protein
VGKSAAFVVAFSAPLSFAFFFAFFVEMVAAGSAFAQTEAAPALLRAKGVFVAYDAAAPAVSVRERKVVQVYTVIPEGDDPESETRVSIEGKPARLGDLEAGAEVVVSWRHDPGDAARREAMRLEVVKVPGAYREELR